MVSNTKGIQQLSDNYENLSKLLTRYSKLNTLHPIGTLIRARLMRRVKIWARARRT
ncbi:SabA family sialic acid-binding adhesin [Helicobacter pylori]